MRAYEDVKADEPIEKQVPLIFAVVATKWRRISYGLEFHDLVSAGFFGLHKARETFDPARGLSFKTWAWREINCYINNEVNRWRIQLKKKTYFGPVTIQYRAFDDEDDASKCALYVDYRQGPEEDVIRRDLLEYWFGRLTNGQEIVMWLECYLGMGRSEVARAVDVCYNTIRAKEQRALKALKSVVDESLVYG